MENESSEIKISGRDMLITQQLMDDIHQWASTTFPHQNSFSKIAHLQDEINEVKEALNNHCKDEIKEEIADCFILLYNLASLNDMSAKDLYLEVKKKMEVNKSRHWGNPDEKGVCHHI